MDGIACERGCHPASGGAPRKWPCSPTADGRAARTSSCAHPAPRWRAMWAWCTRVAARSAIASSAMWHGSTVMWTRRATPCKASTPTTGVRGLLVESLMVHALKKGRAEVRPTNHASPSVHPAGSSRHPNPSCRPAALRWLPAPSRRPSRKSSPSRWRGRTSPAHRT